MSENHLVLYRKYRPEKFSEVCGQEHVVDALKNSLQEKTLAHAYIFAGPRGTGKTSIARILAREAGCNQEDLYEIDAASNRGIDEIRQLREDVRSLPFSSPVKVYIIDEAHMLTREAWNALLKTLEEPPKHVMFVFATTELHKIPDTISSRCQSFSFKKATETQLVKVILSVAKKEGIKITRDGAEIVALFGDGSYRDTHGVLQKVMSLANGQEITGEIASEILGAPKTVLIERFLESAFAGDLDTALNTFFESAQNGNDVKTFIALSMRTVRYALLFKMSSVLAKKIGETMSARELEFVKKIGENQPIKLTAFLRAFLVAYEKMDSSHIPMLPVEIALMTFMEAK